jgi:hypothetical protein
MELKTALRGYLLHLAATSDAPVSLSSEDVYEAFKADFPTFSDFDDAFGVQLAWLRNEGLVRYDAIYCGSNNENCVLDLEATAAGEKAIEGAAKSMPELRRSDGLHIAVASMAGAFIGEFINTQKGG